MISFTTDRRHGDARAPGTLERILKSKKLPISFAQAEQIHGPKVAFVSRLTRGKKFMGADGLLTDIPHQPLVIFTADCVPVFLTAKNGKVIGLLHAGWRGVQKNILAKAVRLLKKKWRIPPSQIRAWAGPHIGPCCFEVRGDVARYFSKSRRALGEGKWTIALEQELRRQATRLGIRWVTQKPSRGCTMHGKRFFSYRRDQTHKRQVSVIMK